METLTSVGVTYQKVKFLGEGLTSSVYKAIRRDSRFGTEQVVALKILKSQNLVSVLQQEFAKLKNIQSSRCVRVLSWESFEQGPALILEYLEGSSLLEIAKSGPLDPDEVDYIVNEVGLALEDLKEESLFHGDLNFKNIYLTSEGKIKLLDFGIQNQSDYLGTPQFLAPERWESSAPNYLTDLFSLGLIEKDLLSPPSKRNAEAWKLRLRELKNKNNLLREEPTARFFEKRVVHPNAFKKLIFRIQKMSSVEAQETVQLVSSFVRPVQTWNPRLFLYSCVGLVILVLTSFETIGQNTANLKIKSEKWIGLKLNQGLWYYPRNNLKLPRQIKNLKYQFDGKEGLISLAQSHSNEIILNEEFFADKNK